MERLLQVKTKTMLFEDYFFDRYTVQVLSVKRGGHTQVKPLKDRKIVAWKLSVNGVDYIVSLREIMEFTLGIRPRAGADVH